MDVIRRQNALDDVNAALSADLTADIADAQLTLENFETVFRRPNDVIAVTENAVLAVGLRKEGLKTHHLSITQPE